MDWLEILTETTQHVKALVTPLIGTSISRKTYGIGAGGDQKKHIDVQAEKAIIETLTEHGLDFTLISEESGIKEFGRAPVYYVITDPVDGTTNFLRGIPFACTSIAVSKSPRLDAIEAGVVTDLFHDTTYIAQKHMGSYCNYEKISPSETTNLSEALLGLDLNTFNSTELSGNLNTLLTKCRHIRHLGANALEICYVADGTIDAFIDIRGKLRTTDMAAATLIIQEAGAQITTPNNAPLTNNLDPTERVSFIATGNTNLHQAITEILEKG